MAHDELGRALDLVEYSQFKYGDGAISQVYGRALAQLLAPRLLGESRPVVVTSSGFGFAPPAAHSLVAPFVEALGAAGVETTVARVFRSSLSNGDYAAMTLEQRQAAVSSRSLSVSPQLGGALVVALDDVRVTGVHEVAMDECLRAGGAGDVLHAYVVDAWDVREDPSTEAVLNASGVVGDDQLLEVALGESFIPNARFCKRVLGMEEARMRRFLALGPGSLREWMLSVVTMDAMDSAAAYRDGCRRFRGLLEGAAAA